jgi:hypothetical protein
LSNTVAVALIAALCAAALSCQPAKPLEKFGIAGPANPIDLETATCTDSDVVVHYEGHWTTPFFLEVATPPAGVTATIDPARPAPGDPARGDLHSTLHLCRTDAYTGTMFVLPVRVTNPTGPSGSVAPQIRPLVVVPAADGPGCGLSSGGARVCIDPLSIVLPVDGHTQVLLESGLHSPHGHVDGAPTEGVVLTEQPLPTQDGHYQALIGFESSLTATPAEYDITLSLDTVFAPASQTMHLSVVPAAGPGFALAVRPVVAAHPGDLVRVAVAIVKSGGFTAPIDWVLSQAPAGVTAEFSEPVKGGDVEVAMVKVPDSLAAGAYAIALRGTAGAITHEASALLQISP